MSCKSTIDCNSEFIVYLLVCNNSECNAEYIGSTNKLRFRMNLHKAHTRNLPNEALGCNIHFNEHNEGGHMQFRIFPFFKDNTNDIDHLRVMEQKFIDIFNPELNRL